MDKLGRRTRELIALENDTSLLSDDRMTLAYLAYEIRNTGRAFAIFNEKSQTNHYTLNYSLDTTKSGNYLFVSTKRLSDAKLKALFSSFRLVDQLTIEPTKNFERNYYFYHVEVSA
jgi:hypothetical protein